MNVQEAYRIMQANCGIKVGDTVKVLRKAKPLENGWGCCWSSSMDATVGRAFTVKRICPDNGIRSNNFWYPFFILELIEPATTILFDAGGRRYAICPDCQTDPLLKLVEGYQEARRDAMEAIQAKDRWIAKHADAMVELKAVSDAAKQALDRLERE